MRRLARARPLLLLSALALATATGCLSKSYPEKRRYVIEVERAPVAVDSAPGAAKPEVADPGTGTLRVGRVRVSPLFERKSFVYQTGSATFEEDFYNEFFAPPGVLVRQVARSWIEDASLFSAVVGASDPAEADWLLEGKVTKLYGDVRDGDSPRAVVAIEFTLLDARSPSLEVAFQKGYVAETRAERSSADALMQGWNASLSLILAELEEDLRRTLPP